MAFPPRPGAKPPMGPPMAGPAMDPRAAKMKALEEIMKTAHGGMAGDMKAKHAKPKAAPGAAAPAGPDALKTESMKAGDAPEGVPAGIGAPVAPAHPLDGLDEEALLALLAQLTGGGVGGMGAPPSPGHIPGAK